MKFHPIWTLLLVLPLLGCDNIASLQLNALNDPIACHMLKEEMKPPTNRQPVSVIARLFPKRSKGLSNSTLAVRIELAEGWHIYGDVPADSKYRPTKIRLNLPTGAKANGDWTRTESAVTQDANGLELYGESYKGNIVFSHRVDTDYDFDPNSEISVTISYQACNDEDFLPPREEKIIVE